MTRVRVAWVVLLAALAFAPPLAAQDDDPFGRITLEEAHDLDGLFDVYDPAVDDRAALVRGWGVPTATDIALAWLVARTVFGRVTRP